MNTVGTRLSRVRFTVSGCVSCGGRFGLRTVEDAGPYDNEDFGVAAGVADTAEPCPYGNIFADFVVSVRRTANGRPYDDMSFRVT